MQPTTRAAAAPHGPLAWRPLELATDGREPAERDRALDRLIDRTLPAIIVRRAFPSAACAAVVDRVLPAAIASSPPGRLRLGPVFGWLKHLPETYLRLAGLAAPLFAALFEDVPSPVTALYDAIGRLAAGRRVATATEPDGRSYAPAVFRAFPATTGHHPHVDSVEDFRALHPWRVTEYRWQLSAVLCLQHPTRPVHPIIYDQLATPEVLRHLDDGTFHELAERRAVRRAAIELDAGDLYVFWAANVHEVPLVRGDGHRVIVAAFIGMDPGRDDLALWA